MKRKWFSIITNVFYLLPAFFGDIFTKIAHILLAITSGRFHWNEHKMKFMGEQWKGSVDWWWQKADVSSIYMSFLFIIGYLLGGSLVWYLLPIVIILSFAEFEIINFKQIQPNHTLIGVLAWIACAIKISISPLFGLLSLAIFIIATIIRFTFRGDIGHGIWHILTGFAKTLLLL